jgi:NhaP-type Na+/H+ or K+/H+ antiporter
MLDVFVIAVGIVAFALLSRRLESWWVTMPMAFVTTGAVMEFTGTVDLEVAIEQVSVLAEITLAVILFSDAARMNVGRVRSEAALPARLLLVGLPLAIAVGTLFSWWILPGLSLAAAALIASVLAPTDAALGEAIVSDPTVPVRVRDALNVEAGLNDGLAVPAVLLFIDLVKDDLDTGNDWAIFLVRQIGGGVALGLVAGAGIAWLVGLALRHRTIDPLFGQLATLATAVALFTAAGELDVNQFIAAFVGGLSFGAMLDDATAAHLDEYTADTGMLLAAVAFFAFGNLFVADALGSIDLRIVVCALLLLTVARMLPVLIATLGMGLQAPTIGFLGWFGPRGLASIVFGILLLEEELPAGDELFDVVALVVVSSVFLHGLTATPGAQAYGRWYTANESASMPESVEMETRRLRRRSRDDHPVESDS